MSPEMANEVLPSILRMVQLRRTTSTVIEDVNGSSIHIRTDLPTAT